MRPLLTADPRLNRHRVAEGPKDEAEEYGPSPRWQRNAGTVDGGRLGGTGRRLQTIKSDQPDSITRYFAARCCFTV
jgi:hypothetical protein